MLSSSAWPGLLCPGLKYSVKKVRVLMKMAIKEWAIVTVVFLFAVTVSGQQGGNPQAMEGKAGKAKAAGDRVAALRNCTEAVCALRLSEAPREKLIERINERDRLEAALISELAGLGKQQKEILALQKEIVAKLDNIAKRDEIVQARFKIIEDKIKSIESELISVVQ